MHFQICYCVWAGHLVTPMLGMEVVYPLILSEILVPASASIYRLYDTHNIVEEVTIHQALQIPTSRDISDATRHILISRCNVLLISRLVIQNLS
jgi:hypothetical protein